MHQSFVITAPYTPMGNSGEYNFSSKALLKHQSFVTTAAPRAYTTPSGNSGDNVSSITALLKALHCRDLLRVIALRFKIVNSMRYICVISQAQHLPGTAGELKRSLPHTLALLSPAHPCRWEGSGYKWLVHKSPALWGPADSHNPALYNSKFHGGISA